MTLTTSTSRAACTRPPDLDSLGTAHMAVAGIARRKNIFTVCESRDKYHCRILSSHPKKNQPLKRGLLMVHPCLALVGMIFVLPDKLPASQGGSAVACLHPS
ncbi:hypothetical protein BDV10DRAFT_57880 [Aspergillus recurvatus]